MAKKLTKIIIFSFLLNLLLISFVFAQGRELEVKYPEIFDYTPETVERTFVPDYIKYIFNFIIAMAGIIALGALIYGGIRYLTSTGQPEKLAAAQKQILATFFGIVILLSSYLILRTINPQLVNIELPRLKQIIFSPLQAPPSQVLSPELLARVREMAEKIKEEVIPGIDNASQNIKELSSSCDCSNAQSLCVCISPSAAKKIAIEKIYSLEYLDSDLLELLKNYPETPCDIFHCSLFNITSLRALATKQLPGTNTFIAQSETEVIENAIQSGKDVYTDKQLKKINKTNIAILHNEDFINKHNAYINKDLKEGCIDKEKADFLKENTSKVTAAADREGNVIVNKEKVEASGLERASGTFAHEYAHIIDGPEFHFSQSDEWKKIYSKSVGYKFEYKEKRLKEVIEWKEKGGELAPAVRSPGFVSDYAYYGSEHEDFAETVKTYRESSGDPNQISNDTKTQQLIKERFEFLQQKEIVKPDYKYKKPEEDPNKKTDTPPLDVNLSSLAAIQSQPIQVSNLSSNTGTCYGVRCYAGPGFQPCPDEKEIKENQKNIIAWREEIVYYKNRALAEVEDLKDEIKKILDEKIVYYMKSEMAEDDDRVKEYLREQRRLVTKEKNLKEDLSTKLEELVGLIEKITTPISEIGALPDQCLVNIETKCVGSCEGGCHDIKDGCQPDKCSGGNPCPTDEIQKQFDEIQDLKSQITQATDEIIRIIDEIVKLKTITI